MDNKQLIGALAMDLKRVSLGMQRSSDQMVEVFAKEALKRCKEINEVEVKPYIAEVLTKTKKLLENQRSKDNAEDLLMYSTLMQNYLLHLSK